MERSNHDLPELENNTAGIHKVGTNVYQLTGVQACDRSGDKKGWDDFSPSSVRVILSGRFKTNSGQT